MNVVSLIGNLASELDVREIRDGHKRASFLLAVDRRAGGGADFVDITVWDREASNCERHLSKGKRIALDGRLRSRSWDGPDGTRRRAVEVVAHSVELLGPRAVRDRAEREIEEPEPDGPLADVIYLAERSMS